jgi:C-terminal processing protease CtpA/Prc
MNRKSYEDYSNQKTSGFGIGYEADFRIYVVLIDSPAYGKLRRGDIIQKINGEEASEARIRAASTALGVPALFTVLRDTQTLDITVTPKEYTHKVAYSKVIPYAGKKVGYLRYDAFTDASVTEIENAFTLLHAEEIDELVLDLRYNGGGSVETAKVLLDNITNAYPGQRQIYLDWNDQYKHHNTPYLFEEASDQDGNELDMQRVFFLTTTNSASASELIISALKPYLGEENIITIGEHTHGKPVGMRGRIYGSNYYFLINFMVKNNDGESISFQGIPPKCQAIDDATHEMGDPDESMLSAALHFIAQGECPAIAQKRSSQKPADPKRRILESPLKREGMWTTPSPSHDWQSSY